MLSNYPNGLSSFGMPVTNANVPLTSGSYFFVSSTLGASGNDGLSIDSPVATIAQAVSKATAAKGDVIICLPGHAESVAAAAGIAISKSGLYIVGLSSGALRPTITFTTATTATLTMTAANCTFDNFVFTQTFDAVVSPLVISAAGVTLRNCYFMVADANYQATQMILTTAAANNLLIEGCQFVGTSDAGTTAAITLVGGDSAVIRNNYFTGAYSSAVGAIRSITTAVTNVTIVNNTIINLTASATKAVTMLTASTGMIANNRVGIGSGAAPFTIDAGWWAGNWSAAAVATNGTLV